jgi:hypothetical protein
MGSSPLKFSALNVDGNFISTNFTLVMLSLEPE